MSSFVDVLDSNRERRNRVATLLRGRMHRSPGERRKKDTVGVGPKAGTEILLGARDATRDTAIPTVAQFDSRRWCLMEPTAVGRDKLNITGKPSGRYESGIALSHVREFHFVAPSKLSFVRPLRRVQIFYSLVRHAATFIRTAESSRGAVAVRSTLASCIPVSPFLWNSYRNIGRYIESLPRRSLESREPR